MSYRSDSESFLFGITESKDGLIGRINAGRNRCIPGLPQMLVCFASEPDCNKVVATWGTFDSVCSEDV